MTLNADVVYLDQSSYNAGMIADDSFENLKEKNERRKLRRKICYGIIAVVLCIIFAIACIAIFFNTENVEIEGCRIYEDYLIRECCNITDQNLCTLDEAEIEASIIRQYPYVKSVKLKISLPSTVTLVVEEEMPAYYFEMCGQYFILSESLRVLEITDSLADMTVPDAALIAVETTDLAYAVAGEIIVFDDADYYEYARQMLSIFEHSTIASSITKVDFSDKYNIFVIYDHRYRIEFGKAENISDKVVMAIEIMKTLGARDTGVINVESDPAYASIDGIYTER